MMGTAPMPVPADDMSYERDFLQHVALLDLLAMDSRPTVVFENPIPSPCLAIYRNPAFDDLLAAKSDAAAYEDWLLVLARDTPDFGGRAWKRITVAQKWTIMCATHTSLPGGGLPEEGHPAITSTPRPSDTALVDHGAAEPGAAIHRSSSASTVDTWPSTSSDTPSASTRVLDWTRFHLNALTPHQQFVKSFPWHHTPVGGIESWTGTLRQYVVTVMAHPEPRLIMWGDDLTMIYNEACIPIFGQKHPAAFGHPVKEHWPEIWPLLEPIVKLAVNDGKASKIRGMQMFMLRHGFVEETFWDFSLIAITGKQGNGRGVVDEFSEATSRVLADRIRSHALKVNDLLAASTTLSNLWETFMSGLDVSKEDVPYALLYVAEDADDALENTPDERASPPLLPKHYRLERSVGIKSGVPGVPTFIDIEDDPQDLTSLEAVCSAALKTGQNVVMKHDDGTLPAALHVSVPGRGFGDACSNAVALPVPNMSGHNEQLACLVIGTNPRRPLDDEQLLYGQYLRDLLSKYAAVIRMPDEHRRNRQRFEQIQTSLAQRLRASTMEARQNEEKFTRMASTAPVGMFSYDPQGTPIYVNDEYLRMFGSDREEFMAGFAVFKSWDQWIHEDDIPVVTEAWLLSCVRKMGFTCEFRTKAPWHTTDPTTGDIMPGERWIFATGMPVLDENDNITSVQGWMLDVSHQKFTQRLLSQRLEEVTEAKRQSENFIDMTSHEMRNPLSAILQSADGILTAFGTTRMTTSGSGVVMAEDTVESILDAAQTIILCASHQQRIVSDILTLSKLDSNLLAISPDKTEPTVLIERVLKMYDAELARANVHAEVVIESTYDELGIESVMMDASRVLQVCINLLTNAIKFTANCETRTITLALGASRSQPTGRHHGVHFVPPRIAQRERELPPEWGYGEELYLQFAVKDTGPGMTDEEMKLLFHRFSQASPKTYQQYGGSGLGLFISRELTELQGGQIGVSSRAGQGSTFTFYVRTRRWVSNTAMETEPPFFEKITSPSIIPNPTAYSRKGSVTVDDSSLTQLIMEHSSPMKAASTTDKPVKKVNGAVQPGPSALHVLVVEDNLINQKVMAKQITAAGHVVHVANHGVEALDFLQTTDFWAGERAAECDPNELSVVLLDLEMPVMDGLTCVRKIREYQRTGVLARHVPVIAVTANARSEQIAVALNAGMDEVVTKPFRIPQVLERVEMLLESTRATAELPVRAHPWT